MLWDSCNFILVQTVKAMGMRSNAANCDLSDILPPELEARVKEEAEISMGTDISDSDTLHISGLCEQVSNSLWTSEFAYHVVNSCPNIFL